MLISSALRYQFFVVFEGGMFIFAVVIVIIMDIDGATL